MADGTPAAEWRVKGEPDPHAGRYDGERSELCMGFLSDDALANEAFLNYDYRPTPHQLMAGTHHMPIAYMTAVKERIRWLSRKLIEAEAKLAAADDVKVCGCLSVANCHSPGTVQCGNVAHGVEAWHDPDTGRTVPKPAPISAEQARVALGVMATADASAWWALVMGAAASIEDAANCLRDPDAKKQADGAAKHYREAAQKLWGSRGVTVPEPTLLQRAYEAGWVQCSVWAERDDLITDCDSVAYVRERDAALTKLTNGVKGPDHG